MEAVDSLKADGEDMAQIELTLVDTQGRRVWGASDRLTISVEGPAALIALDNGDLFDPTDCQSPARRAWRGQMIIYVRSTGEAGTVTIKAEGEAVQPAVLTLEAKA